MLRSLPIISSDHKPIVFTTHKSLWRVVNKPFRFEAYWINNEESVKLIEEEWVKMGESNSVSLKNLNFTLANCSKILMKWSKTSKSWRRKLKTSMLY